jgi:hypothetical protein
MEVTGWYNDSVRNDALKSLNEVYYYMVHSTMLEERRHWAIEYTKMLVGNETHATES